MKKDMHHLDKVYNIQLLGFCEVKTIQTNFSSRKASSQTSKKNYFGPLQIVERIGEVASKLKLLDS